MTTQRTTSLAPCKKKWVELGYSACPGEETNKKANRIYCLLRDNYNLRPRRAFHNIDGGIYLHYKNRTNQYTMEIQVYEMGATKVIINNNFKAKEMFTCFIDNNDFDDIVSDFISLSSKTKGTI